MFKITWKEKYEIALNENLTLKEIMKLRDVGQPTAIKIRNEAIDYCLNNNIEVTSKKIPTDAVFAVTNRNLDFYYDKFMKESEINKFLL